MGHIFISYSRVDKAFVDKLKSDLDRYGADVWVDIEDIHAGLKWSSAIQQALDACTVMVLVLSPDSMASTNVEDEWQYFLDQKKPVIPVMWRPTKIHFQLSRIQYIDFNRQPYTSALGQLCAEFKAMGVQLSGRIPEPPKPKQNRPSALGKILRRMIAAFFRLVVAPVRFALFLPRYLLRMAARTVIVVALAAVIGGIVFVLLMMGPLSGTGSSSSGNTPTYEKNDNPVDVVRFYFEALEAENMDLLNALLCPAMFERDINEYTNLFRDWTFTVHDLTIGELESATERGVRVHFTFTLVMKNRNGEIREKTREPFFFDIKRRDPDNAESTWCSNSPIPELG